MVVARVSRFVSAYSKLSPEWHRPSSNLEASNTSTDRASALVQRAQMPTMIRMNHYQIISGNFPLSSCRKSACSPVRRRTCYRSLARANISVTLSSQRMPNSYGELSAMNASPFHCRSQSPSSPKSHTLPLSSTMVFARTVEPRHRGAILLSHFALGSVEKYVFCFVR